MVNSMTGFAARTHKGQEYSWTWEMRGVNSKGLDMRLRLPDWIDGLEQPLRAEISRNLSRGMITLNLRVTREGKEGAVKIDSTQLSQVLGALSQITQEAERQGLELTAPTTAEILGLKGIADPGAANHGNISMLRSQILSDFKPVIQAFQNMRKTEGAALHAVLLGKVDTMTALIAQARQVIEDRKEEMAETLRANLARVMENADGLDEGRVAQELALLALKSDVTEELDRLDAHVAAANELLQDKEAIGRKLDFLCQEFNREANTLCSKAQSVELTRVGLDLKATIDQIREQIQNVE
ncbi:YicC family protein [Alphaproteobacteria bacterium KMM 3653]|uniref:YicC family protein n=1 Tax=Harenicola maris TaxID=2841044 RepID=A0AAP2CNK0_9RHOB|nr:YicC family protein [Harenicola maris]